MADQLTFADTEYLVSFILTIIVILVKFALSVYLWKLIKKKNQDRPKIKIDFLFSIFLFILFLGIARVLLFYYDFFLTHFDSDLLYVSPNIYVWKIAVFISSFPGAIVTYIIDKQVLNNKFKGYLGYLLGVVTILQLVIPVHDEASFKLVSSIGTIGSFIGIVIPLTFLNLGFKSSGELRKTALSIGFSIFIFAFAAMLLSEPILDGIESSFGMSGRIFIIVLVPVCKIVALAVLAKGVSKFEV